MSLASRFFAPGGREREMKWYLEEKIKIEMNAEHLPEAAAITLPQSYQLGRDNDSRTQNPGLVQ